MLAHFKKMELFTESVDQRLSTLEAAVKENSPKSKPATSLYPKDSNRDKSAVYKYKTSPKAKKKKKSRLISAYETDPKSIPTPSIAETESHIESDEELARKLQRQFNSEAESAVVPVDTTVSDEEYARRLQSLYLKRDMQRVAKKKTVVSPEAAQDPKKKPEEKPSLWSRLFGGTAEEGQTEEENEDTTELKPMTSKGNSAVKPGTYPTVPTTGTPLQPLPVAAPYGFYPQQPFMLGAQGIPQYTSYMPMQTGQYVLGQPQSASHLN